MQLFKLISAISCCFLLGSCSQHKQDNNDISTNYIVPKESLNIGYAKKYLEFVPKINHIKPFTKDDSYIYIYNEINQSLNTIAKLDYSWVCEPTINRKISNGISLSTITCSGKWPDDIPKGYITKQNIDSIKTNIININLNNDNIFVEPVITADINNNQACINEGDETCIKPLLQSITDFNKTSSNSKIIAAINGGFFMRPYERYHYNCLWEQVGRINIDYTKPIDTTYLGNSLIIKDGKVIAYDCALFGKSAVFNPKRPNLLIPTKGKAVIKSMLPGVQENQYKSYKQGIGGGALLIEDRKYAIDWSGLNPFFEFAATSAIALTTSNHLLLLTSDGEDNKSGTFPFETANMLKIVFSKALNVEIESAMTVDRGGSATLILCQPNGGNCKIISDSGSGKKGRPIFSGLGIYLSESSK
jgi:hypothetical protein